MYGRELVDGSEIAKKYNITKSKLKVMERNAMKQVDTYDDLKDQLILHAYQSGDARFDKHGNLVIGYLEPTKDSFLTKVQDAIYPSKKKAEKRPVYVVIVHPRNQRKLVATTENDKFVFISTYAILISIY